MAKTTHIELSREVRIPILYEDRSILAIDKPADGAAHTGRGVLLDEVHIGRHHRPALGLDHVLNGTGSGQAGRDLGL